MTTRVIDVICQDVPNCSGGELDRRRCDIEAVRIEEFDYGVAIGLRFDRKNGRSAVVFLTRKQARSLSMGLWNKVRSPGETR